MPDPYIDHPGLLLSREAVLQAAAAMAAGETDLFNQAVASYAPRLEAALAHAKTLGIGRDGYMGVFIARLLGDHLNVSASLLLRLAAVTGSSPQAVLDAVLDAQPTPLGVREATDG